ncbi:hypothetical protein BGZ83_009165 [Gryganskiella cystojenkinii]|nr:hypothetical protein BGZ83_009165 [Gryganskiella cystojenkinii]
MSAVSVPAYSSACIAPSRSISSVYLAGVPVTNEGRLEFYSVDLTNINSPQATFLGNQTFLAAWSSAATRGCYSYPGNQADPNSPMLMVQFGPKSYFTNMYPNGTTGSTSYFSTTAYVSPKVFSLTGAVGGLNWFAAMTNDTISGTFTPWAAIRVNATQSTNSSIDWNLSVYPTSTPLMSVGTYVATSNTPALGNLVVFDTLGGASSYTTLDSASPILSSADRVMSLSSQLTVDMNGIKLTSNAMSVTMVGVGYILDQDARGGTVLYSITPSSGPKLNRVSFTGNVPPFSNYMSATVLNSQIVTYGSSASGIASATFNSFDTISGQWSGPGLIAPAPLPTPARTSSGSGIGGNPSPSPNPSNGSDSGNNKSSGGSNVAAIAGGVVGGLVVIAAIIFFFVRQRRKNKYDAAATSAPPPAPNASTKPEFATSPLQFATTPAPQYQQIPMMQQQQQQQQQNFNNFATSQQSTAFNPHQSYYEVGPNNGGFSQPMSPIQSQHPPLQQQQQQQQSPNIFHTQQHPQPTYSYVPPTVGVAAVEPQNPNIFQVQTPSDQGSYTQAQYTPSLSAGAVTTPHTPYTQQATTPSSGPASPQYISQNDHGYVS